MNPESKINTKFEFEAIGTHWDIDINEELPKEKESLLFQKIKSRIEVFDKNYSRFRDDSQVAKMSKEAGHYLMPDDFAEMIELYKKAYDLTSGLVTPLIGDVLVSAGYDAKYSLIKKEIKNPNTWSQVINWNKPNLEIKKPAILDFGACGKGYLVDIISKILENEGIKSYVVDASGDMRHRNEKGETLKIGLEHPEDKEKVIGIAHIKNESFCGSAGNRRKWADLHHIINPVNLKSPSHILSIWVIAKSTILSDILTTCLFFVPPEILKPHFDFEYLIYHSNYSIQKSEGFNAEIFT